MLSLLLYLHRQAAGWVEDAQMARVSRNFILYLCVLFYFIFNIFIFQLVQIERFFFCTDQKDRLKHRLRDVLFDLLKEEKCLVCYFDFYYILKFQVC